MTYSPIKIAELGDLNLGGRDFIYLEKDQYLIVAISDMNITSRIDAYLTNVTFLYLHLVLFSMGKTRRKN